MSERPVKKIMAELYGTNLTPEQQALVGELILSASRYSVHHHYGKDETPAAARMRKMRERNKAVTDVTETDDGVLVDNNSSIKTERKKDNTPPTPTPRSILQTSLDSERASAVVEHRQRLRKPLTCRAAKMLAAEFAKAPDPNAAADLMMARGWAGFEVGWLKSREDKSTVLPYRPRPAPRTFAEIKAERESR